MWFIPTKKKDATTASSFHFLQLISFPEWYIYKVFLLYYSWLVTWKIQMNTKVQSHFPHHHTHDWMDHYFFFNIFIGISCQEINGSPMKNIRNSLYISKSIYLKGQYQINFADTALCWYCLSSWPHEYASMKKVDEGSNEGKWIWRFAE